MQNFDRLHTVAQQETNHFCSVQQSFQQDKDDLGRTFDDQSIHARVTNCGIATGLLQHTLREHHGIDVDRLYGEPPLAPREQFGQRRFGHVILHVSSLNAIIDPTYGQLLTFAGADPTLNRDCYPQELALVINGSTPEGALDPLVDALHKTADVLSKTDSDQRRFAPLRGAARDEIADIVRDIYNLDNYDTYPVGQDQLSFDYIQALIAQSEQMRQRQ